MFISGNLTRVDDKIVSSRIAEAALRLKTFGGLERKERLAPLNHGQAE